MQSISPYLVQMRENMYQKNSVFGHFSGMDWFLYDNDLRYAKVNPLMSGGNKGFTRRFVYACVTILLPPGI